MRTYQLPDERLAAFYEAVKRAHQEGEGRQRGHDLLHDVTVGEHALLIAPNNRVGLMAWVAAFCHSQDYLVEPRKDPGAFAVRICELLGHVPREMFSADELDDIADAALRHGEKNAEGQSMVQQTLQDADRLANLMLGVVFRIGQGYPALPAIELEYLKDVNPASTYAEPRSCADDLRNCMSEYEPQFRLPAAKTLGKTYLLDLRSYLAVLEGQYDRLLNLAGLTL